VAESSNSVQLNPLNTDYTTPNTQRLIRYYEKAGMHRSRNPQEFDNRVTRGYNILDSLKTFVWSKK
jgi:hypothetical protein